MLIVGITDVSSSSSVSVAPVIVTPSAAPDIVIVSSAWSVLSFVGVSVNVVESASAAAGITRSKSSTAAKPVTPWAPLAATLTAIVSGAPKRVAPCTSPRTVTVVAPAFSATVAGRTESATDGAASLSSMSRRTLWYVAAPVVCAASTSRWTRSGPSYRLSSVIVSVVVASGVVAPAANASDELTLKSDASPGTYEPSPGLLMTRALNDTAAPPDGAPSESVAVTSAVAPSARETRRRTPSVF